MAEKKFFKKKRKKPKILPAPLSTTDDFEKRIKQLIEKGRRRGRRYSIIGITASILIAGAVIGSGYYLLAEIISISKQTDKKIEQLLNNNNKFFIFPSWRICEQDKDCVETQFGCCDCRQGGKQDAINRQYLSRWQKVLEERCGHTACAAFTACRNGRAVCKNRECRFIEKRRDIK